MKNMGRFGLKIAMCPIFMNIGTQNKSNMLTVNKLIGIDDPDETEICSDFYEIWHSQQINMLIMIIILASV